jgi:hypothetical protein
MQCESACVAGPLPVLNTRPRRRTHLANLATQVGQVLETWYNGRQGAQNMSSDPRRAQRTTDILQIGHERESRLTDGVCPGGQAPALQANNEHPQNTKQSLTFLVLKNMKRESTAWATSAFEPHRR